MLKSKKHVFWEALLITAVIFILGILIGVAIESKRVNKIGEYYSRSEIALLDVLAMNSFLESGSLSCSEVIQANLGLADRVYTEAKLLNKYEGSNRLTDSVDLEHKKYDLLRNFIWINSLKIFEKCNSSLVPVVYLYNYNEKNLEKKALQNVWAKVLEELKEKQGGNIILLPIAVDTELSSVDLMVQKFNVKEFPVVIIGDNVVISELSSVKDLEKYLN